MGSPTPGSPSTHCTRCGARLDSSSPAQGKNPASSPESNCPACLLELSLLTGEEDPWPAADRSGDYEILREVARGGMGVVYLARHRGLQRDVAFKRIASGPMASTEEIQRFYAEGRTLSRLNHSHIVPVYDVGEDERGPYLTMAWMPGGTLVQRCSAHPTPSLEQRIRWMLGIADAVQHAHERGVLHRDLKPSNILFDGDDQPRVADFGLAKILEQESGLTRSQGLVGTPAFMAPELISHGSQSMTVSAEVYALGALLYEMLSGQPPFAAPTIPALLQKIAEGHIPDLWPKIMLLPHGVGTRACVDLEMICRKALHVDPARRYPTAQAFGQELRRWLAGETIEARPPTMVERLQSWRRRHPGLAAALMAASFAISVGLAATAWQWWRAEKLRERSEAHAYAADLRIASQSLLEGNLGRAAAMLALHQPIPGSQPDFAWRYLNHASRGDHAAQIGQHDWIVNAVAWSPDGRSLVSASVGSGTIGDDTRLWRLNDSLQTTQSVILQWRDTHSARAVGRSAPGGRSVAWMPDGQSFWVGHVDQIARHWDAQTGRILEELPGSTLSLATNGQRMVTCAATGFPWAEFPSAPAVVRRLPDGKVLLEIPNCRSVALSPDGQWLATSDGASRIEIHQFIGEQPRRVLSQNSDGKLWGMTWSPDARRLVITGWDDRVRVWDFAEKNGTWEVKRNDWHGHNLPTWRTAFSKDGRQLLSSSSDQTLISWNLATGQPSRKWRGHSGEVWCVAVSPDGKHLASGGKDGSVLVWSVETPPPSRLYAGLGPQSRICTFQDQQQCWVAGLGPAPDFASVMVSTSKPEVARLENWSSVLGLLPHGTLLTGGWQNRWYERSWPGGEVQKEIPLELAPGTPTQEEWAVSPDGRWLAGSSGRDRFTLWDCRTGRKAGDWSRPRSMIYRMAFSQDGRWLAVVLLEEGVLLYATDGSVVHELRDHKDMAKSARFSRNGRWFATCSVDGTIRLMAMTSAGPERASTHVLVGHKTSVEDLDFDPENRVLASVEAGEGVRLWDLSTLREVAEIRVPAADTKLVFRADGLGLMVAVGQGWECLDAPHR